MTAIHHAAVFVRELESTLALFTELLGFRIAWRVPAADLGELGTDLELADTRAELVYLECPATGAELELIHLLGTNQRAAADAYGAPGSGHLSLAVADLVAVRQGLAARGVLRLTPISEIQLADGRQHRLFFARTASGLTLEFIAALQRSSATPPEPGLHVDQARN